MLKFKQLSVRGKIGLVILLLVYVSIWGVVGFTLGKKSVKATEIKSPEGTLITENIPEIADVPNPINGTLYTKREAEIWKNRVPLAIMVENSITVRPQSGLSRADIVYEALAEGGITRFVAIYLANSSQVGPVRSAREYYYDWIEEYKAAFAHWGGNEYVRAVAQTVFGARDLDQFAVSGAAYYRVGSGEHSGYTHTDKLWSVATNKGVNKRVEVASWPFKDDSPAKAPNATEVTVNFAGDLGYIVGWSYDQTTNSYKRFNAAAPHLDKETGSQLAVKNVIVVFLTDLGYRQVTPGVSNRDFQTIGQGAAKIFLDGLVIDATWKKETAGARMRFFDASGKEIALNRGPIWMEMVPARSSVTFK